MTYDQEYLRSSTEEHQIFQTDKFKAGLLICSSTLPLSGSSILIPIRDDSGWDLALPEAFRALMLQGVEVVIVPTCWVLDDVGELGLKHDPE